MPLLDSLEKSLLSHYRACELCPRRCGVDRTANQLGFCGEGAHLRIATIEPHLGEEPQPFFSAVVPSAAPSVRTAKSPGKAWAGNGPSRKLWVAWQHSTKTGEFTT